MVESQVRTSVDMTGMSSNRNQERSRLRRAMRARRLNARRRRVISEPQQPGGKAGAAASGLRPGGAGKPRERHSAAAMA